MSTIWLVNMAMENGPFIHFMDDFTYIILCYLYVTYICLLNHGNFPVRYVEQPGRVHYLTNLKGWSP